MIKKSDLYASLWSSCDELRGGMDASQYKDYVLVLLFIKCIADVRTGRAVTGLSPGSRSARLAVVPSHEAPLVPAWPSHAVDLLRAMRS